MARSLRLTLAAVAGTAAIVALAWAIAARRDNSPPELAGADPADVRRDDSPAHSALKSAPPTPIPQVDFAGVDHAVVKVVKEAQEAVSADVASGARWGELGLVLLAHELDEPAGVAFAEAARLSPKDPRWPYLQAFSLDSIDSEDAVPLLEASARLAGDQPDAPRLKLVEVLIALNRNAEAAAFVRPFLNSHPDNARANLAMGRLKLREGDLTRAVEHARMAESNNATRKSALQLLAQVELRQGKPAEARQHQGLSAKSNETSWPDPYYDEVFARRTGLKAMLVRADRLFGSGDVRGTIPLLREAVQQYPDSDWAHVLLGRSLIRDRQLSEAEQVLRKAVELAPESVEAQFRLGVAIYMQKRQAEAAEWFRKAVALKPDFGMAHYNLGHCLMDLRDVPGAVQSFEAAANADPANYEVQAILGTLLAQEGRSDEAVAHWQQALALRPHDPRATKELQKLQAQPTP